jgi:hypothetical protein
MKYFEVKKYVVNLFAEEPFQTYTNKCTYGQTVRDQMHWTLVPLNSKFYEKVILNLFYIFIDQFKEFFAII